MGNNKNKYCIIIVILLVLFGISGYILLDYYNKTKVVVNYNRKNENKEEYTIKYVSDSDSSIDDNIKKELLDLIGLTENGLKRMSSESIRAEGLDSSSEWIYSSVLNNTFWKFQKNGVYKVDDLDKDSKMNIIFNSILSKDNLEIIYADEDENHPCYAGAGFCYGVSEELYKTVAKRYGFNSDPKTVFDEKYDNYYLIHHSGSILSIYKIVDEVLFEKISDEIKITYNVILTPYSKNYNDNIIFYQTITFNFKQVDGTYNLSTFEVVNK